MTPREPSGSVAMPAAATPSSPRPVRAPAREQASFNSNDGWFLAVEFVTATMTWGGIGWLFDRWLGTDPWLMVVGFVVGNMTGLYLLYLRSLKADAKPGPDA